VSGKNQTSFQQRKTRIYIYKFYKNYLNIFSNKKAVTTHTARVPVQFKQCTKGKGFIRRFINRPVSDPTALSVTVVSNR
jgi:hypothetical protein